MTDFRVEQAKRNRELAERVLERDRQLARRVKRTAKWYDDHEKIFYSDDAPLRKKEGDRNG